MFELNSIFPKQVLDVAYSYAIFLPNFEFLGIINIKFIIVIERFYFP